MNDLQNLYLKLGDELFEQGSCEEALTCYQKAYEQSDSGLDVLSHIRANYVLPHEECFRQNLSNRCGMMNFSTQYEDCQIDFLPVSDKKYVLFDRKTKQFCGSFDLKDYEDEKENDKTFQSVLIADNWDAREILTILNQHIWNNVYIVLNDSLGKFMSFFKLPGFASLLPENVHIFESTEKMCCYFAENPGAYLPHVIHAPDQKGYEEIVDEIHRERIQSEIRSDNVFLSICIPSYNRGKLALEAVQHALQADYDAEIEILVSNNGSYIGKEEYETIQDMNDSRVCYYELEKNEGLPANVCNCLEKASGHFAVLFSDEEHLIAEKLGQLLDYLWHNQELGGFKIPDAEDAMGRTLTKLSKFKPQRFYRGWEAVHRAWRTQYISGVGFNVDALKQYNILQKIDKLSQNSCAIDAFYPHCTLLAYLAAHLDIDDIAINLWIHGEDSAVGGFESPEDGYGSVKPFTIPENRWKQEASSLEIVEKLLTFEDYKKVFLQRVNTIFSHISEALLVYRQRGICFSYNWEDIHIMHYKNCLKIMQGSKWGIEAFDETFFHELDEVFFDWLDCRRIRPLYSEEENLKATLRAQIARYYYDHGVPFLEIDFKGIDKKLDSVIGQAMPGGQSN